MRETIFGSPEELLLDLNRDLMQPSLSPLCPVLLVPGMGLKLSYPIFCGAKLSRLLARHFEQPAGTLPRHQRRPGEAVPKWPGLPGQVDRQPSGLAFGFGAN